VATPVRFGGLPDLAPQNGNGGLFSFLRSGQPPSTSARGHIPAATERLRIPKFDKNPASPPQARIDLATTLQYGQATGLVPLYNFIKEFAVEHVHGGLIPYSDPGPDILLTCGSTDGFAKIMGTFGERGDSLLVEEFCYMPAVQSASPLGIGIVPVGMDEGGMRTDGVGGLRDILDNWDEQKGRKPHLMYTVT
jgi:DNA-binding transcriptional MocR family regulator